METRISTRTIGVRNHATKVRVPRARFPRLGSSWAAYMLAIATPIRIGIQSCPYHAMSAALETSAGWDGSPSTPK